MTEASRWVSEKEAIELLKVDKKTLEILREEGYLNPGTHWRSSPDPEQLPWKPKVFYFVSGCKEVIEYKKDNYASLGDMAA
tara:strand:+ start:389 stop:631 length:243 start_codon:yes stop_codon:yes gene_type:complete